VEVRTMLQKGRRPLVGTLRAAFVIAAYRAAGLRGRPSLRTIMNYYGCDKGTAYGYAPRFFGGHDYAPAYERHLLDRRDRSIRLLEIGIGLEGPRALGSTVSGRNPGGASLKVWREFFPQAQIYGMDINDGHFLDGERLTTFVGDQSSRSSLNSVAAGIGEPLDVIIDDGSHASSHQQITVACLARHLAEGGLYVIEDIDYQPPQLEDEGDVTTAEVVRAFQATGEFRSVHITEAEREYIEHHLQVVEFFKASGAHDGELVVLTKRGSVSS
jgi:hypothetical protein